MLTSVSTEELCASREALLAVLERGELLPRDEVRRLGKIEAEMAFRGLELRPQRPHPKLHAIVAERMEELHRARRRWHEPYYRREGD